MAYQDSARNSEALDSTSLVNIQLSFPRLAQIEFDRWPSFISTLFHSAGLCRRLKGLMNPRPRILVCIAVPKDLTPHAVSRCPSRLGACARHPGL